MRRAHIAVSATLGLSLMIFGGPRTLALAWATLGLMACLAVVFFVFAGPPDNGQDS